MLGFLSRMEYEINFYKPTANVFSFILKIWNNETNSQVYFDLLLATAKVITSSICIAGKLYLHNLNTTQLENINPIHKPLHLLSLLMVVTLFPYIIYPYYDYRLLNYIFAWQ